MSEIVFNSKEWSTPEPYIAACLLGTKKRSMSRRRLWFSLVRQFPEAFDRISYLESFLGLSANNLYFYTLNDKRTGLHFILRPEVGVDKQGNICRSDGFQDDSGHGSTVFLDRSDEDDRMSSSSSMSSATVAYFEKDDVSDEHVPVGDDASSHCPNAACSEVWSPGHPGSPFRPVATTTTTTVLTTVPTTTTINTTTTTNAAPASYMVLPQASPRYMVTRAGGGALRGASFCHQPASSLPPVTSLLVPRMLPYPYASLYRASPYMRYAIPYWSHLQYAALAQFPPGH